MTPDELIAALAADGRTVHARTLKDWRKRGLLPPLHAQSRGRGRGIDRRWIAPNIFERASVVCLLLERLNIVDEALVSLASVGYRVDPEILRKAWLSRLDRKDRLLAASARRRKDGMDGLLPTAPPNNFAAELDGGISMRGVAQLLWELHRVHLTGNHIENDEAFVLIESIAQTFGVDASEQQLSEFSEIGVSLLQVVYDRSLERELVLQSCRSTFFLAQIYLNQLYRINRRIVVALKLEGASSPTAIMLHSISSGPLLLKLALTLASLTPSRTWILGFRAFERWSARAEFTPAREGRTIPTPTKRTEADLRRTCRATFGK